MTGLDVGSEIFIIMVGKECRGEGLCSSEPWVVRLEPTAQPAITMIHLVTAHQELQP